VDCLSLLSTADDFTEDDFEVSAFFLSADLLPAGSAEAIGRSNGTVMGDL